MRVGARILVSAPASSVWAFIADPAHYLHFMHGVTRWEVAGDAEQGIGARYRTLMHVGSAEIGGLVEVVEWDEPTDLAWTSVTGIDQRGRWRLRERDNPPHPPRTDVELRLSYGVAGSGPIGWLAERIAAPTVRGHLRRSLQQLKRQVEHEQLRLAAARRREAKQRSVAGSGEATA
jgi:carbon monoxide dehydrogenase subunit G